LVLVLDSNQPGSSVHLVTELYNLSPAESRLAAALASGKSVEAYSLDAGITLNTARTHVRNIYGKTGTRKQGELVALLCRTPSLR
jgi:DNA-binding CsgD family transcriptional regulator